MFTFDNHPLTPINDRGDQMGKRFDQPYRTHDVERFDQKMHEPLAAVTWSRDIDLRNDVTIADEVTSFSISTYGSPGGLGQMQIGNGKSWIGRNTTQIQALSIDIAKIPHPLRPWGQELKYTILELESAAKVGRPIDAQKVAGIQLKHQMDTDEQVYFGDLLTGGHGPPQQLVGVGGHAPAGGQQLADAVGQQDPERDSRGLQPGDHDHVGQLRVGADADPGPDPALPVRVHLDPAGHAGGRGLDPQVPAREQRARGRRPRKIEILPCKWCIGMGNGGTLGQTGTVDRMAIYTKDEDKVRFPMTILQKTPIQFDGIFQKMTYFGRLGVVEAVYPETVSYWDGLLRAEVEYEPTNVRFQHVT